MRQIFWFKLVLCFLLFSSAYANTVFTQRKDVQFFIHDMVTHYHFDQRQLTSIMNQVHLQPKIIESMEKPYEQKPWDVYKAIFLTPQHLQGGLRFWAINQKILAKIQRQYGIPAEIIVAILGVETLYGDRQGDNLVLDALATLAFEYPKRSAYFTKELKEYLLLCREHHVPATYYKGSYAGAIGKPQFMPSSYRHYAIDYNKKGHRDLVNNDADAIASIANFLHQHGWMTNQGIAQSARLNRFHRRIYMNPKNANYRYAQLINAGVKPITAAHNHPARAGLIELTTQKGNEYWIAYPNFFVITRYNTSPQYALAVYLLAQQLKQQWNATAKKHRAYA